MSYLRQSYLRQSYLHQSYLRRPPQRPPRPQHRRLLLGPTLRLRAGIAENGTSEPARVAAAVALLDRGWGKPKLDAAVQGEVRVVRVTLRKMLSDDDEEGA